MNEIGSLIHVGSRFSDCKTEEEHATAFRVAAYAVAARRQNVNIVSLSLNDQTWWQMVGRNWKTSVHSDLIGVMAGIWADNHTSDERISFEDKDWDEEDDVTDVNYALTSFFYQDEDERDLEVQSRMIDAFGYTSYCLFDQNLPAIDQLASILLHNAVDVSITPNECVDMVLWSHMFSLNPSFE